MRNFDIGINYRFCDSANTFNCHGMLRGVIFFRSKLYTYTLIHDSNLRAWSWLGTARPDRDVDPHYDVGHRAIVLCSFGIVSLVLGLSASAYVNFWRFIEGIGEELQGKTWRGLSYSLAINNWWIWESAVSCCPRLQEIRDGTSDEDGFGAFWP